MARRKWSLEDFIQIAESKGGKCLSESFTSVDKRLQFECEEGHQWTPIARTVVRGTWCQKCAGKLLGEKRKNTSALEEFRTIARKRGGECLAEEYKNAKSGVRMLCAEGHEWDAILSNLRAGNWCPKCARAKTKLSISVPQGLAIAKGGKCLSNIYINLTSPLEWECQEGHTWKTPLYRIKDQNRWCPECARKYPPQRLTLEIARREATKHEGRCLSEEYVNSTTPMKWECKNEHQWSAPLAGIRCGGQWCPMCSWWKRETECRIIFEEITVRKFSKIKPTFLRSISFPRGLELDGFNEEMSLAFEYQGEQHYEYIEYFHKGNKDNIRKQQERDALKEKLCDENWITLIVIPYWIEDLRSFIYDQIDILGYHWIS